MKITTDTSSIAQIFGGKRLMSKGFALVIVSAVMHAARRFDGKYDGRFFLKIAASVFTVVSV